MQAVIFKNNDQLIVGSVNSLNATLIPLAIADCYLPGFHDDAKFGLHFGYYINDIYFLLFRSFDNTEIFLGFAGGLLVVVVQISAADTEIFDFGDYTR